MKLFIKNMVSIRCRMVVTPQIENIGLHPLFVELGEVKIKENISGKKYNALKVALLKSGLELMEDRKAILIEKIKNVIVEMIHYSDELPETNFLDLRLTRHNLY